MKINKSVLVAAISVISLALAFGSKVLLNGRKGLNTFDYLCLLCLGTAVLILGFAGLKTLNRLKINTERKDSKSKSRVCGKANCIKTDQYAKGQASIRAPDDNTAKLSRISSEILMNEITNNRDEYAENIIILMKEELKRRNKYDEEKHKHHTRY